MLWKELMRARKSQKWKALNTGLFLFVYETDVILSDEQTNQKPCFVPMSLFSHVFRFCAPVMSYYIKGSHSILRPSRN